jgi:hypothetical protein
VGRAPQHRQGPGPNERPHWWRTRRGRSYKPHTAEALAEDQSRRSGSATGSEGWGWRGGTSGGPGPMDIEEVRGRSHEPTAMRPELGLGWPGSILPWTGTTCRAASLDCPEWSKERDACRGAVRSGRRRRLTRGALTLGGGWRTGAGPLKDFDTFFLGYYFDQWGFLESGLRVLSSIVLLSTSSVQTSSAVIFMTDELQVGYLTLIRTTPLCVPCVLQFTCR